MRRLAAGFILALAAAFAPLSGQSGEQASGFDSALDDIRQQKYPEAVQKLSNLLAIGDTDPRPMVFLGYLYSIRGDDAKAAAVLTRAISRDDRNIPALLLLADLYYRQKDLDMARELYLRIDGLSPDIQMVNIRLYELTKFEDKELSHRYYLKALQLDKTDLRDFLGLQGSGARGLPPALEQSGAERPPLAAPGDRTNDIVQLFLYDQSPSTNIDEPGSNVIVLAKTKVPRSGGFRLFRGYNPEQAIGRGIGSVIILLLFWIVERFRKTGRQMRMENKIVYSHYRKKF